MKFLLLLLFIQYFLISNTWCMPNRDSSFGNNYLCYESGLNLGFGAELRKVRCPPRAFGCMTAYYGEYIMIFLM